MTDANKPMTTHELVEILGRFPGMPVLMMGTGRDHDDIKHVGIRTVWHKDVTNIMAGDFTTECHRVMNVPGTKPGHKDSLIDIEFRPFGEALILFGCIDDLDEEEIKDDLQLSKRYAAQPRDPHPQMPGLGNPITTQELKETLLNTGDIPVLLNASRDGFDRILWARTQNVYRREFAYHSPTHGNYVQDVRIESAHQLGSDPKQAFTLTRVGPALVLQGKEDFIDDDDDEDAE